MPTLLHLKSKISSAALFSIGLALVFVPIGVATGSLGGVVFECYKNWLGLTGGILMVIIGLWALRLFRLPLRAVKVHNISGGIFVFGMAYALATIGRGAPMLVGMLSIVALNGDALGGGISLLIYSFSLGMPVTIFALTMDSLRLERRNAVVKASKMLERISGVLLVALGVYYIASALILTV
ncbi:MAG: cytochrome c biogenesis CcdA family protein [Candidatus Methanomethylicaceae archaeon]